MRARELRDVNYKILRDFNISFFDNESQRVLDLIVIAGVNGSGKSTILDYIELADKNTFDEVIFEDRRGKIIYLKAEESDITKLKESIRGYIKELIFDKGISPKESYKIFDNFLKSTIEGIDFGLSFDGLDRDENIYFRDSFGERVGCAKNQED